MLIKFFAPYRFLTLVILFIFSSLVASAQTGTVKGTVKDASGLPVAGASVLVEGTKKGTTTNATGNYSLDVPPGTYNLVISYVGTETQRFSVVVSANSIIERNAGLVSTGELAMVTVGSRSSTVRTRMQTPVPVDVIQISQVVNDIGQVELSQILNFIAPSFQSARQTIADGTDHVDPAQLRGLGTDQVLVLVNGKRRHQSSLVNVNGTVNRGSVGTDMSAIPASAIERIEILRDGAAAQYGSDAIAGVINIVLKKRTGVLEAAVSYGQYITTYEKNYALYKLANKTDDPSVKARDGGNIQASVGYGFKIDKGYLNLTGEYIKRDATNRTGTYTGAVYPNVGGVNRDDSIMASRRLDRNAFDMHIGNSDMKGGSLFYNFVYPMNERTEQYSFGGFSKKSGIGAGFYRYPSGIPGNAKIYASNVFALYPNGFLPQINSDLTDVSTTFGIRTKGKQWNADLSYTLGMNKFDFTVDNSANYTQFSVPGNTQTSFNAGGLKFWQNTFNGDISRKYDVLAGLNVAAGLELRLENFNIISGEEASFKNYDVPSGASAGAQVFAGFINPIPGHKRSRNAKSVYIDLEQDITKNFLVTGALRYEHYSDFGSTLNYKLAGRYKFGDVFNLRASVTSGFRAPSMQQIYYTKTNTLFVSQGGNLVPIQAGTFTNDSRAAQILGIPTLTEETSKSYSAGFAAKPFKGFELTVDAYQIDIDNRIVLTNNFSGGSNAQLQALLNAAGASTANFFTNAIDTRARGLETVLSYNTKFARKHSLKFTLAAIFIDNEVKKGADGKPIVKASPVLISSGQLNNYFNREDQSRIEVANPQNKVSLTLNYKVSKFGAMVRFVNFGKVQYLDPTINPANPGAFPANAFNGNAKETLDQLFESKLVTDISLSYQVAKEFGITIGANNLLDVYQDRHTHSGNMSSGRFVYSRRVQQHGFNGAYYFVRLKLELPSKK
jgi:iron complex outermembrane receptor protein